MLDLRLVHPGTDVRLGHSLLQARKEGAFDLRQQVEQRVVALEFAANHHAHVLGAVEFAVEPTDLVDSERSQVRNVASIIGRVMLSPANKQTNKQTNNK